MTWGGARRGAGRPRKEIADLKLAGGFRPTRHRHLLRAVQATASTVAALDVVPGAPAEVLEGLQPMGTAFVRGVWLEAEGFSL